MSCLPELTYAIYVDGELTGEERRQVETHLAACASCRTLVEGLRGESRLLANLLQDVAKPVAVAARPVAPRDVLWTTFGVLAAAAVLQPALSWLAGLTTPLGAEWLNPFTQSGQVSLVFSGLSYVIEQGADVVFTLIATVSALVFGLLILAGSYVFLRRRPSVAAVMATAAFALLLAQPSMALERHKTENFILPSGETIDDTVMVIADTIRIDGVVTGNLFAFCGQVRITGTVQGDAFLFSQNTDVEGTIEGNTFAFAQQLTVPGQVGQSVFGHVGAFQFESSGQVKGDVFVSTGQANLGGTVGRDVFLFAGKTSMEGTVGRNLTARTGRLTLLAPARVEGDLSAYVKQEKNLKIDPQATVAGETRTHLREPRPSRFTRPKFYLWEGISLAGAFLTGFLLFWLFPALFGTRLDTPAAVFKGLGLGFLALVATPIAAIIVAITLVGLPIAVISLALWVIGLYLAKILVAAFVGQALTRPSGAQPAQFALALLVGLLIVHVAFNIPYVGWLIQLLVLVLGLGITVLQAHRSWPKRQPA